MSNIVSISAFLKKNKAARPNVRYAATKSLCDENGEPVEWELRPITTKENDELQNQCISNVPVPGKPGRFTQRVDTVKYMTKLVCASVVNPDLYNAELQDSYGVSTPEALVQELVDDPGEWNELSRYISQLNGFKPLQDEIDDVKN